jgi:hypothetical protein
MNDARSRPWPTTSPACADQRRSPAPASRQRAGLGPAFFLFGMLAARPERRTIITDGGAVSRHAGTTTVNFHPPMHHLATAASTTPCRRRSRRSAGVRTAAATGCRAWPPAGGAGAGRRATRWRNRPPRQAGALAGVRSAVAGALTMDKPTSLRRRQQLQQLLRVRHRQVRPGAQRRHAQDPALDGGGRRRGEEARQLRPRRAAQAGADGRAHLPAALRGRLVDGDPLGGLSLAELIKRWSPPATPSTCSS